MERLKASKLPETKLKFEDSKFYEHMKYVSGDAFEFQCDKYAYILQTGNKTDVADVTFGDPGVGKDTYYNYLGNNIIGEQYYLNEDFIDMIIGDSFNDIISKKVLIVLNESKKAKTDEKIEAIKNAITREKNTIRAKHVKSRSETNYINWNALTNTYDSIQIQKGDRRFCANKISNLHKGDTKYFNSLYNEIQSKKYDRACYDFFMSRIIKVKSFQDERPITAYYNDLQERSIPITAQFLIDLMHNEEGMFQEQATLFYNRYEKFLSANGYAYKTNITKFGLEMKQYAVVTKESTKKYIIYKIDIDELEKYLINEKLYKPTNQVDNLFVAHKKIGDVQEQINDVSNTLDNVNQKNELLQEENDEMKKYIMQLEKLLRKYEPVEEPDEKKPTKKINKMPKLESETKTLRFKTSGSTKDIEQTDIDDIEFDI